MSLTVTAVRVADFRNYGRFELEPDEKLTVLVGPNAVGKTNLMEALQLLTEAESFRKPAWGDTVRQGADKAVLTLEADGGGRHLVISLEITSTGRRTYKVNGKIRRSVNQVSGVLPCVLFTPDDLRFLKDSAERRRTTLDSLGSQLSPSYSRLRMDYDRALRQRNSILRDEGASREALEPWTDQLVALGARMVETRRRLFGRIAEAMANIYPDLTDGQQIVASYIPSWERDGVAEGDDLVETMRRHLKERGRAEKTRRATMSGPHRDEIAFEIEGRDARVFASQGQQRTIALAWKLAEVEVIGDVASQRPVLLLDDVMSELDKRRRHALASYVGEATQTFITTTNLGYFEEELLERAKVVHLG